MIQIKGKYCKDCKIFTDNIEQEALSIVYRFLDHPMFEGSKIRIMPDVHAGKGCTIGTTMTVTDKIVPSLVGVDIGCGVIGVKISDITAKDFRENKQIRDNIISKIESVPSGTCVHSSYDSRSTHCIAIKHLKCADKLINIERLYKSCGTLGGGNHYIEIGVSELTDELWLFVHTGSRNIGKQVAEYYQGKAIKNQEERFRKEIDLTIERYKNEGKENLLSDALKQLKKEQAKNKLPDELCYLDKHDLSDYIHDVQFCRLVAMENRRKICEHILEEDIWERANCDYIETEHNFIATEVSTNKERKILRKGAVSAERNEKFLIPMNMRDGTLVCVGRGNPEWNYSAPHGAGRLMGRGEAMRTLSMEDYKNQMAGIFSNTVDETTLDEAPMAYKPMDSIIANIKDTAYIVDTIKPVYNFKHSEVQAKKNYKTI